MRVGIGIVFLCIALLGIPTVSAEVTKTQTFIIKNTPQTLSVTNDGSAPTVLNNVSVVGKSVEVLDQSAEDSPITHIIAFGYAGLKVGFTLKPIHTSISHVEVWLEKVGDAPLDVTAGLYEWDEAGKATVGSALAADTITATAAGEFYQIFNLYSPLNTSKTYAVIFEAYGNVGNYFRIKVINDKNPNSFIIHYDSGWEYWTVYDIWFKTYYYTKNTENPSLSDGRNTVTWRGVVPEGGELVINSDLSATLNGVPVASATGKMPVLKVGSNTLTYSDAASGSHTALLTLSWTETAAVAPKALKQNALEMLKEIQGKKHAQKDVEEAIKHVEKSLEERLWEDEWHVSEKHGSKVFDEEKTAVEHLMKITEARGEHEDGTIAGEVQGVIDSLVKADELLAARAIQDALNSKKKVQHEIEKAQEELAKGQAEAAKGSYDKAIDHFKKAWKHAQDAV